MKNYAAIAGQLQPRYTEREFWMEFLHRQKKCVRYANDVPGTAFDDFEDLSKSDWNLAVSSSQMDCQLEGLEKLVSGHQAKWSDSQPCG